jgi:hypothetical protein
MWQQGLNTVLPSVCFDQVIFQHYFYLPQEEPLYLCNTRQTHLPDLALSSCTTKNVNSSFNDVISSLSWNCWWNHDNFLIPSEIISSTGESTIYETDFETILEMKLLILNLSFNLNGRGDFKLTSLSNYEVLNRFNTVDWFLCVVF